MATAEHLKSTLRRITPNLEQVLATGERIQPVSREVQLRDTQCGLATAALQTYLLETQGIETQRSIIELPDAPRGINFRKLTHVILQTDEHIIDPTYGQFMHFVGLTPQLADQHNIAHLYPNPKIMVVPKSRTGDLSAKFASHAHKLDEARVIPPNITVAPTPPVNALRDTALADKQRVYDMIWDLDNYRDFAVTSQRPGFQDAARKIADSLKYLDQRPT